jgi:hypothetical protein
MRAALRGLGRAHDRRGRERAPAGRARRQGARLVAGRPAPRVRERHRRVLRGEKCDDRPPGRLRLGNGEGRQLIQLHRPGVVAGQRDRVPGPSHRGLSHMVDLHRARGRQAEAAPDGGAEPGLVPGRATSGVRRRLQAEDHGPQRQGQPASLPQGRVRHCGRRLRGRILAVVLCVSAALVSGGGGPASTPRARAAANGSATWQPPTTLFAASPADAPVAVGGPDVAFDDRGNATAVWELSSPTQNEWAAMEAEWSAQRGWTRPQTLSGADVVDRPPQIAVDARGDALAVWLATKGQRTHVRAAYRPAGEPWRPARTVSRGGEDAAYPVGTLDSRGRALVAWSAFKGAASVGLEVAARSRLRGWGRPSILSRDATVFNLAMSARGHAIAVWSAGYGEGGLWADARTPAGHWSRPKEISSSGTGLYYMPLVVNSRGSAVVAWVPGDEKLTVAIGSTSGRFGQPEAIGRDPYWGFALALAPTGEAVATWAEPGCCLFAKTRRPGARTFASEQVLSLGHSNVLVGSIATDARGDALALWTRAGDTDGRLYVHAARRPAGGTFEDEGDLADVGPDSYKHSACGSPSALATRPDGDAVAVWLAHPEGPASTCTAVEAATFGR